MSVRTYVGVRGTGANLAALGPIVLGRLRPTLRRAAELLDPGDPSKNPAEPPMPVELLVDTGAMGSFVAIDLARRIGLRSTSREVVRGIGGDVECPVYAAMLDLPVDHTDGTTGMMPVRVRLAGLERELSSTIQGLLGRDFLQSFAFAYEGPTGRFILATSATWRDR